MERKIEKTSKKYQHIPLHTNKLPQKDQNPKYTPHNPPPISLDEGVRHPQKTRDQDFLAGKAGLPPKNAPPGTPPDDREKTRPQSLKNPSF